VSRDEPVIKRLRHCARKPAPAAFTRPDYELTKSRNHVDAKRAQPRTEQPVEVIQPQPPHRIWKNYDYPGLLLIRPPRGKHLAKRSLDAIASDTASRR